MAEATEIISCPACNHLLRVPLDWLGQAVKCPECRAMFKAPVRVGGALSAPELISLADAPAPAATGRKWDVMLILPAFGLLLCGAAGTAVDGLMVTRLFFEKDGGREWVTGMMLETKKMGFGEAGQQEGEAEEQTLRFFRWFIPLSTGVSLVVFAGGLSMVFQRHYRLAQVGCVLAIINVAGGCCIPGTVAGLWGLLMLSSEEGRRHFQ